MSLRIETFAGGAARPHLDALADLRIAVFRDWPYLYQGSRDDEAEHLSSYLTSTGFGLVVAFDGDRPVGCSTCLPLAEEKAYIHAPFATRGLDPRRFFYFGESVLLPHYRGQGVGVAFFAAREAHARAHAPADLTTDFATFCGVRRDAADPRRPAGFQPLDPFWRKRGYAPLMDVACIMRWTEVGADAETPHTLDFWAKSLTGAALP